MTFEANNRTADHAADPMFLNRWSPRAFTGEAMPQEELLVLFEAARWAPSAFNAQPWRFVYGHKGTDDFDRLLTILVPYNQMWAKTASVLAFAISDRFRRVEGQEPSPIASHGFDTGAAWGYLALQASLSGWAAHGMAGFDPVKAYADLGVDEADYRIEAAIALGRPGDKELLEEPFRSREIQSPRKPVEAFIFEGVFKA